MNFQNKSKANISAPTEGFHIILRFLVAGERCNITGEYFERGSTSE